MTNRQRRIVFGWSIFGIVAALVVALDLSGHDSWLQPILFGGMIFFMIFDRPSRDEEPPAQRLERIAREYPVAKWWLGLCALGIATNAFIAAGSSTRLFERLNFVGIMGILVIAIGPMLAIAEYEKFKSAGQRGDDAI